MKRSPRPTTLSNLYESVQHRLNMYALAASAAGVSALALAPLADARVVYTPAHILMPKTIPVSIDLNHDGISDVQFYVLTCVSGPRHCSVLYGRPFNRTNLVWGTGDRSVAALPAGRRIARNKHFQPHRSLMAGWGQDFTAGQTCTDTTQGPWRNAKNRYIGLQFVIKGKVHYGWLRLNVTVKKSHCPGSPGSLTAVLTGYAYETIPGKAIIAGQTNGTEGSGFKQPNPTSQTVPAPEPATLGALAMGAPGLSIWRRKDASLDGQ